MPYSREARSCRTDDPPAAGSVGRVRVAVAAAVAAAAAAAAVAAAAAAAAVAAAAAAAAVAAAAACPRVARGGRPRRSQRRSSRRPPFFFLPPPATALRTAATVGGPAKPGSLGGCAGASVRGRPRGRSSGATAAGARHPLLGATRASATGVAGKGVFRQGGAPAPDGARWGAAAPRG